MGKISCNRRQLSLGAISVRKEYINTEIYPHIYIISSIVITQYWIYQAQNHASPKA